MTLLYLMLHPMTDRMLHPIIGSWKYEGMVFTSELIKLLVYHRIKRAHERNTT